MSRKFLRAPGISPRATSRNLRPLWIPFELTHNKCIGDLYGAAVARVCRRGADHCVPVRDNCDHLWLRVSTILGVNIYSYSLFNYESISFRNIQTMLMEEKGELKQILSVISVWYYVLTPASLLVCKPY